MLKSIVIKTKESKPEEKDRMIKVVANLINTKISHSLTQEPLL